MPKLPQLSGRRVVRILEKFGYKVAHQKGSHMRLECLEDASRKPVTVPDHHVIGKGLLHKILRDAHIDLTEFLRLK